MTEDSNYEDAFEDILRSITRRKGPMINNNILEFGDIKLNIFTYNIELALIF